MRVRLFLSLVLLALPAAAAAAPLEAQDLRCEYRRNPLGVDEARPRLYWRLSGDGRGREQRAYQIRAASAPGDLQRGRQLVWDSGWVDSASPVHIEYGGPELQSRRRIYWQVRLRDERGRAGEWSSPAHFEMGLLQRDDWKAAWIGRPEGEQKEVSLAEASWIWFPEAGPGPDAPVASRFFRRTFEVADPAGIDTARIYIAADDQYQVYVNGAAAGEGSGWQSAAPVEIKKHLRPGRNVIAIRVTNNQGPAGLLGLVLLREASGREIAFRTDAQWLSSDEAGADWRSEAFDASGWKPARIVAAAGQGPWGGPPRPPALPGPAAYLRRQFGLDSEPATARLYVTALGVYEARLNGRKIGDQILAPGWTDYRRTAQYQVYDVTDLVRRGANALGAIVGDGWYAGALGWGLQRNHFGASPPRFKAQLEVVTRGGEMVRVVTGSDWQSARGPIDYSDIYAGEKYDARRELTGWDRAGTPSGEWSSASVYTDPDPALRAEPCEPIRMTQRIKPVALSEPAPGTYIFDLGQNMVGAAQLRGSYPAGTTVRMRFGEELNRDGTLYTANLRSAAATDTYIFAGRREEAWRPHFTYHGFRYVEVTGLPDRPDSGLITGLVFHTDQELTGSFACGDSMVNRLYANIIWGLRGNLMSVPTDCPQRDERLGWMGDAQLFARSGSWLMDLASFWKKWMRDIEEAQSPAGGFSDVSPRVVDLADGAPAWAEAGLVVPWTSYLVYGDRRILRDHYPAMRRYVDLLLAANPDLIWKNRRNNDFGDWVAAGPPTDKDLIASAYFAYDLQLLGKMAAAINLPVDAEKYLTLAARAREAFDREFRSPDGVYRGDTQTAYAMALQLGLTPPQHRRATAARLAEIIRLNRERLATGFIGTAMLLPALSDSGRDDLAFRLLRSTRYPSWGYMVDMGATTIWELWNSNTAGPGMNSRNHFAFGTVAEWLQRYAAGIEIDEDIPGYAAVLIRPRVDPSLGFVDASYQSIRGKIRSSWRVQPGSDGLVTAVIEIPPGSTAAITLPAAAGSDVWEGKRRLEAGSYPAGIRNMRREENFVTLSTGSGVYTFTFRLAPQAAPGAN